MSLNFFSLLGLIPKIIALVPTVEAKVKDIGKTGFSLDSLRTVNALITDPQIKEVFDALGAQMFPQTSPEQQASAAIVTTYAKDYVKKVQTAMNKFLQPSPALEVDGYFGEKSKAAVKKYQTVHGGLVVDGWPGVNTMKVIDADLAKA